MKDFLFYLVDLVKEVILDILRGIKNYFLRLIHSWKLFGLFIWQCCKDGKEEFKIYTKVRAKKVSSWVAAVIMFNYFTSYHTLYFHDRRIVSVILLVALSFYYWEGLLRALWMTIKWFLCLIGIGLLFGLAADQTIDTKKMDD